MKFLYDQYILTLKEKDDISFSLNKMIIWGDEIINIYSLISKLCFSVFSSYHTLSYKSTINITEPIPESKNFIQNSFI